MHACMCTCLHHLQYQAIINECAEIPGTIQLHMYSLQHGQREHFLQRVSYTIVQATGLCKDLKAICIPHDM